MGGAFEHRLACGGVLTLAGQRATRGPPTAPRPPGRPEVLLMAVVRRRAPIAMHLGRARRRAVTRRASIVRYVQATSSLVVEAWSPAPVPAPVPAGLAHPPALVDPSGSVALPMGDVPPPDEGVPAGRMRRCAFRRLDLVAPADPRAATTYAVVCLYLDAADPTPIGDLETAVGVCGACTYPGVFRPDQA